MKKRDFTILVNWLISQGFILKTASKNNSYYLFKDKFSIRISDHLSNQCMNYTLNIFLSPFDRIYSVFFIKQCISIKSLKELKQLLKFYNIISGSVLSSITQGSVDWMGKCSEVQHENDLKNAQITFLRKQITFKDESIQKLVSRVANLKQKVEFQKLQLSRLNNKE